MIVGISGPAGSGKSTLAGFVCEKLGATRLSFGDLLKDECAQYFEFERELCDTPVGKRLVICDPHDIGREMTVREALQWYGTEYRRAQNPEYWCDAMRERILGVVTLQGRGATTVIDDVRFVNEARFVRGLSGMLVRLKPFEGWKPGPGAEHESETALNAWKDWDVRLAPRYGELSDAAETVVDVLGMFRKRAAA